MSIGALAFLNPWLLAALATLPVIYWLLRTVPPRPQQIEFPPTRILVGLENREKTPSKTPWWLTLIRLLAAAAVIFALADPVLNPERSEALQGSGPVVITIDNGWASATRWSERMRMAERLIVSAEQQNRPVVILATARSAKAFTPRVEAPADARTTAGALQPQPFAPERAMAAAALESALATSTGGAPSIVWLTDGIDHGRDGSAFGARLAKLAGSGSFTVLHDGAGSEPMGLAAGLGRDGKLEAKVMRPGGAAVQGAVYAFSARSQRLGEQAYSFGPGDTEKTITFDLPLELRNQVARVEIASERSAGAVSLLDARSQWQRVGLVSGEAQEQQQPLLAPLYYIQKAMQKTAEIVRPKDQNVAEGIAELLKENATVLVLADIGTLSDESRELVEAWVKKGGILVRFAGPRLEQGGDDLLPVALRVGGRTLGGALSWEAPQPLAAFDAQSLFAGLTVPADVTVTRQVLADPALLTESVNVWARLKDGTPLVTATKRGDGQVILFHVTANTEWSNLPISGLFVDMLQRIATLGRLGGLSGGDATVAEKAGEARRDTGTVLSPLQTLDGFGRLGNPPSTAEPIPLAKLQSISAALETPPGLYGAAASPRAINALTAKSEVVPLPSISGATEVRGYENETATPLKPWLLGAALALLFADMIAVLLMQVGGIRGFGIKAARASAILIAIAVACLLVQSNSAEAGGQRAPEKSAPPADTSAAQQATSHVTFGYILSGDSDTDAISKLGLMGLGRVLATRTAVEPGEPIGVDITKDEIAFFPVLYWPVLQNAEPLPEPVIAKIDAYMKQGGLIVFDTKDYGEGRPEGFDLRSRGGTALQRLLRRLDIPRLEPVPEQHVLTKSFYLLRSFPGRWDGGQLWVEAIPEGEQSVRRKARVSDGVTSIMITSNDFAAAWALDDRGRPVYPVVPGGETQREMSFRSGVNIVMHALTGNYKADQVHVPALLERLGQ